MYRPDGRSSTRSRGSVGTSHVAKPDPVKPRKSYKFIFWYTVYHTGKHFLTFKSSADHANISTLKDALCVDNKDIAASQQ